MFLCYVIKKANSGITITIYSKAIVYHKTITYKYTETDSDKWFLVQVYDTQTSSLPLLKNLKIASQKTFV